ncbi:MAG: UbiA family prenyltransferase [Desulfatibacillum sp.]|nr:UbiA family prenyltransferase [Desulfatibacillum sp.]
MNPAGQPTENRLAPEIGGNISRTVKQPAKPATEMLRAMRPHQWVKNFLIFTPVFTGHHVTVSYMLAGLAAFLCFSLCASALYLINDVLDREADKIHPVKKFRPFASGTIPHQFGVLAAPLLLLAALACSIGLPLPFMGVLGFYLFLGLNYSLWLKRLAFIDTLVLALMYTLRIIAGGAATAIPISMWLLAFSMFFFTSLAMAKRYVEVVELRERNRSKTKGRGYSAGNEKMLRSLGISSGMGAVITLALYVNSMKAADMYLSPALLWFSCPLLLFWISRVWFKAQKGLLSDDPIVFALRDKISLFLLGAIGLIFIAAGWV